MTALENGVGAVALSSGAAAVRYAVRNLTSAGSNIVTTPQLYGASLPPCLPMFSLRRVSTFGLPQTTGQNLSKRSSMIGLERCSAESIGNPAGNVIDLPAVCAMAHSYGVPVIVDNTVASPMLLKPVSHGADIVVHSMTKFIGGHGTSLGGIVIDGGLKFKSKGRALRFPCSPSQNRHFMGSSMLVDFPKTPISSVAERLGYKTAGRPSRPSMRSCLSWDLKRSV